MSGHLHKGQEYVQRFFQTEIQDGSVNSLAVSSMLSSNSGESRLICNQLDECLELAYRKKILSNDRVKRLKSPDYDTFEAAFSELKVAKFIESLGNEIEFDPPGREERTLDFKVVGHQSECLVEVTTMFESGEEKKEARIIDQLWECAREAGLPLVILQFSNLTADRDFRKEKFKHWLKEEIQRLVDGGKKNSMLRYSADQGFLVDIEVTVIPKETADAEKMRGPFLSAISNGEQVCPGHRLKQKLEEKVKEQLPKEGKPCLVIVSDQYGLLFKEEVVAVLYGKKYIPSDFPLPEVRGSIFSPNQNTRLNAVGIYECAAKGDMIQEWLTIYHNPYNTQEALDMAMFGAKIVDHCYLGSGQSIKFSLGGYEFKL